MEVAAVLLLVLFGVASYGLHKIGERNVRTWQSVARELGLHFEGDESERTLQGELDGVSVRASYRRQLRAVQPPALPQLGESPHLREQVTFHGAENGIIPARLVVRRDEATRLLGLRLGGRDMAIGDAAFDELVELPELDAESCAALSHRARQLLQRFLKHGGEVRQGVLWCQLDGGAEHERDSLLAMLQFLAQLGSALAVTRATLPQRLSENAVRDPDPGVRWRNLRFLAAPDTQTPPQLLTATAHALLGDPSGAVRTLAARQLGAQGFAVLQAEARSEQAHHELRLAALQALAEQHAPDLEPLLAELLAPPQAAELVAGALGIVAQQRRQALLAHVTRWAEGDTESVRRAAAAALGKLAGSEPVLLRLLQDPSPSVQQATVEALAEAGSVRAVEPLLPLSRGLVPGALRSAARAAIAQIQARLGNVEGGRVSLADQQEQLLAGAVDLADVSVAVRAGELSLADDVNESGELAEELRRRNTREHDAP